MTTIDFSTSEAPAAPGDMKPSFVALLMLTATGFLLTNFITFASSRWLVHMLPVALAFAALSRQALRAPVAGSLLHRLARDPHLMAFTSILSTSGPVGAGVAYYLSGSFGLQEAAPAIVMGAVASALGIAMLMVLTLAARRADIRMPGWVLIAGLTPVLAGAFLAFATPTADEELDAIFAPHFALAYDDVRTAYLGYEVFPREVFEDTFGMSKAEFLTAWLKIREDYPALRDLRLPGGEAI